MSHYWNRPLECQRCGVSFIWTSAEQAAAAGIEPRQCPACAHLLPAPGRERGLIKWYNGRRGYGFIVRPTGDDLFFHRAALPADAGVIAPALLVEYGIEHTAKGPQANQVRVLT